MGAKSALRNLVKSANEAAKKLEAYHGTPHEVDRFSMEKIGTGEGAQAYGHGLYFAESPDVAETYKQLPFNRRLEKNGEQINAPDKVRDAIIDADGDIDKALDKLNKEASRYLGSENKIMKQVRRDYENAYEWLDSNREGLKMPEMSGNLYKVELDIDPDTEMLDWDLPFNQQSPEVQGIIERVMKEDGLGDYIEAVKKYDAGDKKALKNAGYNIFDYPNAVGGMVDFLNARVGGEKATKMLTNKGIKGIRYDDGFSRDKEGGTKNFVVFDDSLIRIAEKNGIPMQQVDELAQSEGIPKQQALAMLIGGTGGVALMGGTDRAEAAGMPAVNGARKSIADTVAEGFEVAAGHRQVTTDMQDVRQRSYDRQQRIKNAFFDKRNQRKVMDSLVGAGEVGLMMGSSYLDDILSGLAGTYKLATDGADAASAVINRGVIPSYTPKTEAGMKTALDIADDVSNIGRYWSEGLGAQGRDPIANAMQSGIEEYLPEQVGEFTRGMKPVENFKDSADWLGERSPAAGALLYGLPEVI